MDRTEQRRYEMRKILTNWSQRRLEKALFGPWHECELCGDIDHPAVHAPLSTGEVVCWSCAEQAGEFSVPHRSRQLEWRFTEGARP